MGSKHFQIRSDVFALEVFHSGYRYLSKHSVGIQTPEESFVSCNSMNYSLYKLNEKSASLFFFWEGVGKEERGILAFIESQNDLG